MSPSTTRRRPTQADPDRKCGWFEPLGPNVGDVGCLKLTVAPPRKGEDAETFYLVERLASDFGLGFRLEKVQAVNGEPTVVESYDVNLDGQRSTCECRGWLRWGRCKHLASLQAMQDKGRL